MIEKSGKLVFMLSICIFSVCARAPQYSIKTQPAPDPVVIHERIGKFIDPEEREYYDLFHGIEGFREAVFFKRTDGGFDILIMSERHTYYAIYDAFQADEIVHDYIESFDEKDSLRDNLEKKWCIVGYDTLGLPVTRDDVARILATYRISAQAFYGGCFGSCLGTMVACLDFEIEHNQATHIISCSGDEDVPFWCVGGCLAGVAIANLFEKSSIKRNPVPHINKQRGPWIIE